MKIFKSFLAVLTLTVAFSIVSFAQQTVTLPSLGGPAISLENQKGKVVVLALGASWLPLSSSQANITSDLARRFASKDVVLYFVATDSTAAKSKNFASDADVQAFVTKNKLTVPILRDSDGSVTLKSYKADQIPSFVILDKEGRISGEPFGGVTQNAKAEKDLANQIAQKIDGLL
jgi:peroxiredoxin